MPPETHDQWTVDVRINKSGNLAIEVALEGVPHAEFILQEDGTLDVGTKSKPWPLGESGWEMPGAPTPELRKFRFGP
jgi:hypothetical protein